MKIKAILEGGSTASEILTLNIEDLLNNQTIREEIRIMWEEKYNTCICSLTEGNPYCECEGKYGYIEDIKEER